MNPDLATELEKQIDHGVKIGKEFLKQTAKLRGVGDVPVSKEERLFDYQNRGPDYWPTMLQGAVDELVLQGKNLGDALLALCDHVEEMEGS